MRILETKSDEEEYTRFLESNERCNFQQSLEWAKVKTSWKREVILAEDSSKKIIGSLMVWIRKIPIFGNIMYSARGPVCDVHNIEVLKQLTEGAKLLAKKYNAKVIAFAGSVTKEAVACNQNGIDAFFPIVRGITTLAEAMDPKNAKSNMAAAVEQVFRLL